MWVQQRTTRNVSEPRPSHGDGKPAHQAFGIGTSPDRVKARMRAVQLTDGIGTSPDRENALRLVHGLSRSLDYDKEVSMADDGIGTSPDREKAQRPSEQDGIGTSPKREKRESPNRPEGIGTSP